MPQPPPSGLRVSLLHSAQLCGVLVVVATEFAGLLHLLTPAVSASLAIAVLILLGRHFRPSLSKTEWLLLSPLFVLIAILAVIAAISPPNTFDALGYHLPRVVFWAQQSSVANFPTSYLNQLQSPPFAEYLGLHTFLLTGGDHLVNLIQWAGYTGSVLAVSALADELGATRRGQLFAACIAATIPNAILQATGAKNDCVVSFWIIAACLFTLRADPWIAGAAIALALLTKGTAYLFLPPLIVALGYRHWRCLAWPAAVAILLLNGPFYLRNYQLSGSPLGFDSAHGDGRYRVLNDTFAPGVTISNAARGLAGHFAFRDPAANGHVYRAVLAIHDAIGRSPDDPTITWPDAAFTPPQPSNHEANSPNRWHLLLLIAAACYALASARSRRSSVGWFAAGWIVSWIIFFSLLRWQPYGSRLQLPLFFTGAALAGLWLDSFRPRLFAPALCLLLFLDAKPYVLENWLRPLTGPTGIFATTRNANYFRDVAPVLAPAPVFDIVRRVEASRCRHIGLDTSRLELEYPFLALLCQNDPSYRFQHVNVANASAPYAPNDSPAPCAVLCIACGPTRESHTLVFNPQMSAEVAFARAH